MNAWVFAVVLALAVATAHAGHLGLAPISTGVISTRIIAAPTLVAAPAPVLHARLVAAPAPLLHSGLVAAPLSTGFIGTRTLIGAPAFGHLAAAPLATSIW